MTGATATRRINALGNRASDLFAGVFAGFGAVAVGFLSFFFLDWWWLPLVLGGLLLMVAFRVTWRESRLFGVTTLLAGAMTLVAIPVMLSAAVPSPA
jgi:hypothetical protein